MHKVISTSANGKKREIVVHIPSGKSKLSVTRHEVLSASGWGSYPPLEARSPWPAGKNFLRGDK